MAPPGPATRRTLGGTVFTAVVWVVFVFLTLPSVLTIPISFSGGGALTFRPSQMSLDLYRRFFTSPVWTESLVESLIVATLTAAVATVIGSLAAFGLARGRFPGRRIVGFLLMSPIVIPSIVVALGVYFYFSSFRLVGTTLGLVLAHAVLTVPYVIVMVGSALQQLEPNIETAAGVMGATRLRVFTHVVVPQIQLPLLSSYLFAFLISFDEVVISWFISGTSATTLPVVMYSSLKVEVSPEIAAAATILSAASILVILAAVLLRRPGAGVEP